MTPAVIDLRSDTFTAPDRGMRRAMAEAAVGDDVWGEDPTVRLLEETVSALLGKEAAVYVPSGTMANLLAVAAQCTSGDEVIADVDAHMAVYEAAGSAVVCGVQLRLLDSEDGTPDADAVTAAVRPSDIHQPVSRLLALENTHNRRGGGAVDASRVAAAARAAHSRGLHVHCDGARLFNAAVALGCPPADLVRECDSVSVCLSKGLGAPVGSVLAADAGVIDAARHWRKRLGGGMRQAGGIAAAGVYALEHNVARLADDHANAESIAVVLRDCGAVEVVRARVPTNIVLLRCADATRLVAEARALGVLVTVMGPRLVRCTTYLGVSAAQARRAARLLTSAAVRAR